MRAAIIITITLLNSLFEAGEKTLSKEQIEFSKADSSDKELLTKDKEIFKPGRKWIYSASFITPKKDTVDSQKVKLEVFQGMFYGQKKVKWRYYKNGKWEKGEETGVDEDSEQVFLHPPRRYDFRFTELSDFPIYYCQKTLCITKKEQEAGMVWKQNRRWSGELSIGKGWGKWENLTVKTYAKVVGKKDIKTLMGKLSGCWQIDTEAKSKIGIYKATYYFHPQYGFVRWEYTKPTGEQAILDLEKVTGF